MPFLWSTEKDGKYVISNLEKVTGEKQRRLFCKKIIMNTVDDQLIALLENITKLNLTKSYNKYKKETLESNNILIMADEEEKKANEEKEKVVREDVVNMITNQVGEINNARMIMDITKDMERLEFEIRSREIERIIRHAIRKLGISGCMKMQKFFKSILRWQINHKNCLYKKILEIVLPNDPVEDYVAIYFKHKGELINIDTDMYTTLVRECKLLWSLSV